VDTTPISYGLGCGREGLPHDLTTKDLTYPYVMAMTNKRPFILSLKPQ